MGLMPYGLPIPWKAPAHVAVAFNYLRYLAIEHLLQGIMSYPLLFCP